MENPCSHNPHLSSLFIAASLSLLVACGGAKTSYDALFVRVGAEPGLTLDRLRFFVLQEVSGQRDVVPRDPDQFPAFTFPTDGRDLSRDPLAVKLVMGSRFRGVVTVVALGFQGTRVAARGVVDADLRERREVRMTLRGWPEGCDQDLDGFPDCATPGCCATDERFLDCDDSEPRATPVGYEDDCTRCGFGEALVGDGVDDDCDGTPARCRDEDGDQAIECLPAWCQEGGESEGSQTCKGLEDGLDCGLLNTSVFPGAPELCDNEDNDCDGQTDEEIAFKDWDGTLKALGDPCGTGACEGGQVECHPETKKARCSTSERAAATEVCGNQVDDNCNGFTDDPVEGCVLTDTDGDGVVDEIELRYCGPLARYHSEIFPEYDEVSRPDVPQGVKHVGDEPCCCGHDTQGPCPELCDWNCDGVCEGCAATDADCDGFPSSVDCNDDDPTIHPGAPEKCGDGVDQDCKGGDLPCTVGTDKDGDGFLAGLGDCDDNNRSIHPWAREECNGLDDDCDGFVDDGNPEALDERCGSDVGECELGWYACTHIEGQAPKVLCRDDRGPAPEACDGKDNDCDASTDEDFFYDEKTGQTCRGDESSCSGRPGVTMACDGVGECGQGLVECLKPPSDWVTCSTNRDGSEPQARAEVCNNLDDDCDGLTDEELTDVKMSDCIAIGVCKDGFSSIQAVCHAGKWSCDYSKVPGYESGSEKSCDERDNDCDGETDEDFAYPDPGHPNAVPKGAGCGTGACANGTVVCSPDHTKLICDTTQLQTQEVCDGLDNDCDGLVDEDFQYGGKTVYVNPADPGQGRNACTGIGECGKFPGVVECATITRATCSTNPDGSASKAQPETCNNQDDDCDGQTDENLTSVQDSTCKKVGVCLTGMDKIKAVCQAGEWSCNYAQVPNYEAGAEKSCDGLDNDCNGQTDEDFSFTDWDGAKKGKGDACGTGLCAGGQVVCTADKKTLVCSTSSQVKVETCNNQDDDCDGQTDENLTSVQDSTCKKVGVCLAGMDKISAVCNAGKWFCDYGKVPGYEAGVEKSCDSLDNDCDGETDEDFEYTDWNGTQKKKGATCGTGLCAGGVVVCRADQSGVTCSTAGFSKAETCNNVDDNCNGTTDENTDALCSDGKTCTEDKCLGGTCQNTLITGHCLISGTCYTDGTPNPQNQCQHCKPSQSTAMWANKQNGTICDFDGDGCTQGDSCQNGVCQKGTPADCSSLNTQCVLGYCFSTGPTSFECRKTIFDGQGCNDGNPCTKQDKCVGETCQGTAYSCDDNAPCTVDTCLGDGGCSYSVAPNYCEIPLGSKYCVAINAVKPDNECLACLPAQSQTAWSPRPPDTGCDDGNACTIGDRCDNGTCQGTPLQCEAWNPTCSGGVCYCDVGPPAVQCDGSTADTCSGGVCQCGSSAACTQPNPTCSGGVCYCDPATSLQCSTSTADTCASGGCNCGTAPACDPASKNPTCSGGQCKCGTTVCDDRSDQCTNGACKCGTLSPCGIGKVCCNGTCKNSC